MTIEVSKQSIGNESVILWTFQKDWQWQDFIKAVETSNTILNSEPEKLCLILNVRFDLPDDKLALPNLRRALTQFEGCDIIFVTEGAEMSSNLTLNVLKEEFPELSEKVSILHTLDEAYLNIDPNYSGRHTQDLPKIITEHPPESNQTTAPHTDQTRPHSDNH